MNDMEFYAHHGCSPEEQAKGNEYIVNITMDTEMEKASQTDNLSDALNYVEVYELVKAEMEISSHLLEHLSNRILDRLFERFPKLDYAKVSVSKLNPPIEGKMKSVEMCQQRRLKNTKTKKK